MSISLPTSSEYIQNRKNRIVKERAKTIRVCKDCDTRLNAYNTDIRCYRCDTRVTREKIGISDGKNYPNLGKKIKVRGSNDIVI